MNILFVINSIEPGGAEVFLLRFAKALKERGNNVFVLPLRPQQTNNEFLNLFTQANVPILKIYEKPTKNKEKIFWKLNALFSKIGKQGQYVHLRDWDKKKYYQKILSKNKIQVINSHLFDADFFAVDYLKKINNLPVIITMHSSYNKVAIEKRRDSDLFILEVEALFKEVDYLTYLTEENKYIFNFFQSNFDTPLKQVYLGYERPSDLISDIKNKNSFNIGMIARGIKEKGWEDAIEAFEILQKNHASIELFLICPLTEFIKDLKIKYSANTNIKFIGYVPNPEQYFKIFDLSILPSYYPESLPVTIIESLAFGIPVIASNVGEIPKMLKTEKGDIAGKILNIDHKGKIDANLLSREIENYIVDPLKLAKDSELALEASKKFSMDECINNYMSVFQTVINK